VSQMIINSFFNYHRVLSQLVQSPFGELSDFVRPESANISWSLDAKSHPTQFQRIKMVARVELRL
jgi:hypothetical protein